MNNLDYYFNALKNKAYGRKEWVYRIFSFTKLPQFDMRIDNYDLCKEIDTVGFALDGKFIALETQPKDSEPLFLFTDKFNVSKKDAINVPEGEVFTTTAGKLLVNYILLIHNFQDRVMYLNDSSVGPGDFLKLLEGRIIENKEVPTETKNITINEFKKFNEAVYYLAGFSNIAIPTATPRTMTVNPEIIKLRNQILKENPEKFNDIAWVAEFEKRLIEMDKEWIRSDPDGGFEIGKTFNIIRKKQYLQLGAEFDIVDSTKFKLIPKSLNEGVDIENLPVLASSARLGSYSRGMMTALGGEKVKIALRFMSNVRLISGDCGSKIGIPFYITPIEVKSLVKNIMIENGKQIVIERDTLKPYIGKTVIIRHPTTCKAPGIDFCAYCVGLQFKNMTTSPGVEVANVGQVFQLKQMKKMHGNSLSTVKFNYLEDLF